MCGFGLDCDDVDGDDGDDGDDDCDGCDDDGDDGAAANDSCRAACVRGSLNGSRCRTLLLL